ncbi:hypothetical protein MMC30_007394 [Trapelia coarctata]|nr:hypothetical protein [Trapelia coarctata]
MASEVLAAIPKSILKRSSTKPDPTPQPPQPTPRQVRNRELALEQAHIIQQRKDIESSIFAAIETLLDFPPSPNSNPACPSTADVAYVKEHLKLFQPADYDSLVEERGINGKCGYALCPRPHRVENTSARYRILRSGRDRNNGMKVVEKKELERWCSDECGKMALYLRVQLSEVPAQQRTRNARIQIYGECENGKGLDETRGDEVAAVTNGLQQLAIERGETGRRGTSGAVEVKVVEKDVREPDHVPSLEKLSIQDDDYHESSNIYGSIEGYRPKIGGSRARRRHWEDELHDGGDIMDTI